MAIDTPLSIRNLVIYEIFTRNHSREGSFTQVERDLERIRSMGVDVIWFMPIHPIGVSGRKGSLGSPYSIMDYRQVNPELGDEADFARLIQKAHSLGLKVMIDVVYNHTSHDSRLVKEHPEWFFRGADGMPASTVSDWSDVVDLQYSDPALEEELIDTLIHWLRLGVDGFRCDVASIVPISFWMDARRRLEEEKPGVIWLAESVNTDFIVSRRRIGLAAFSDCELYSAFDITYDYDIWPLWHAAVRGKVPQARYLEMLRFQDSIYPANYAKLRAVENHDQPRIQQVAGSSTQATAWTAFMAFNKGPLLIYAGQEAAARHKPTLFDRDPIKWNGYPLQSEITRVAELKKHPLMAGGDFYILEAEPAIQAAWYGNGQGLYGIFNTAGELGKITTRLPDGIYLDQLTGKELRITGHMVNLPGPAVILDFSGEIDLRPFYSELFGDL